MHIKKKTEETNGSTHTFAYHTRTVLGFHVPVAVLPNVCLSFKFFSHPGHLVEVLRLFIVLQYVVSY